MLPINGTAAAAAPIAPVQAVAVIKKLRFSWSIWLGAEKDNALLLSTRALAPTSVFLSDIQYPCSPFEAKFIWNLSAV
jgi:hypothetical protein